MKALIEMVLALVGLVEAETKAVKKGLVKTVIGVALVVLALVLLVVAIGFLDYGIFCALAWPLGRAWAAVLVGGITLILGLILAGVGRWLVR